MTVTDRDAPGTTVSDVVCAPVEENEMSFSPDVSSFAVSSMATGTFAQLPNVYSAPPTFATAVVVGAAVSGGYV